MWVLLVRSTASISLLHGGSSGASLADGPRQARGGRPHEPDCPSDPGGYGLLSRLRRSMDRHRPPGVPLRRRWRSPLRGPWLTSVFGTVLLIGLPIMIITGLLSYMAYAPRFGQALPAHVGWLKLPTFDWPSRPAWLYRLTQGVHVGVGLVLVPVVIAKLWSVIPRLFIWPPARSIAQVLERISLVMRSAVSKSIQSPRLGQKVAVGSLTRC